MTRQIIIGLYTEGTTDERFLHGVVRRTFEDAAFEATGTFDFIIEIVRIEKSGLSYIDQVLKASIEGVSRFGITILCLHKDADFKDNSRALLRSINPAIGELKKQNTQYCKVVVPIIPAHMTESWLFADKALLKRAMGTKKIDAELGIDQHPEKISDPKKILQEAIRIAMSDHTKRRRNSLAISDLYMPLGDQIDTKCLEQLNSYIQFKNSVRDAFIDLSYLPKN